MKAVMVTGPGINEIAEVEQPVRRPGRRAGPDPGLRHLRIGRPLHAVGGIPPRQGATPLGHEPAGEVVEVGADVAGLAVGDHVVINPMAFRDGLIGSGGRAGRALASTSWSPTRPWAGT